MILQRMRVVALPAAALLLGLVGGAVVAKRPTLALLLCIAVVSLIGLAVLGDRAFAWALVVVAVAPWYPFVADSALPPIVPQKILCAAVIAAAVVPWLWSVAASGRRTPLSRLSPLLGILFAGFAVLIHDTLGNTNEMLQSNVVGFLAGGATFLCARRFSDPRGWPGAAFAGYAALVMMGLAAYAAAPDSRIGAFTGYPITYGALVVGLLPLALVYAARRSRPLAVATAALAGVVLVLSESRSSWVAATVLLIVLSGLLLRRRQLRALAGIGALTAVAVGLILTTGTLHNIVERKLSSEVASSDSVTHRVWSYGYAIEQFRQRPVFGAGAPGYAGQQAADATSIGAIDNGYLSITVDLGLLGLLAAFVPIAVGLWVLGRCLRLRVAPATEVALALGIVGIAVVTIFYDSFYWAQLDLLLFGMGGVLSVRLAALGAPSRAPARGALAPAVPLSATR
jgi:O-antigen ligase